MLLEKYADVFEVSICSSSDRIVELLQSRPCDIAVLDADLAESAGIPSISLPLILWSGGETLGLQGRSMKKIRKYQRISSMKSQMLDWYAEVSDNSLEYGMSQAHVTAVWSPAGGSGKTTTALSYAAQLVSVGKKVVYLDLEPFSSTSVYFQNTTSKGLSSVFEKLQDGNNIGLLLQSIRQEDRGSGIFYFNPPDNYEDMEILTELDVLTLIRGAASGVDEVVVDLGSTFDIKVRKSMECSDTVFLVVDGTQSCKQKCEQFRTQHSIYEELSEKLKVISNRGGSLLDSVFNISVKLPTVESTDPIVIYKTLSGGYFKF